MTRSFDIAAAAVGPPDSAALADAVARQSRLTKPAGALGRLESVGIQLCGIAGCCPPPRPVPAAVAVFAGDHGVLA
ncbi:MAG: nicotinate-nucleotide--dimethylbenzimidazole phosphoribosyltransferase, partial [Acidimicrobiaceae bacterium]|nr:nicotinate-nucleotide--dimethylbenzimidazole phosphoribosyltransferase [Acidimicrobiaceae bacterium]